MSDLFDALSSMINDAAQGLWSLFRRLLGCEDESSPKSIAAAIAAVIVLIGAMIAFVVIVSNRPE